MKKKFKKLRHEQRHQIDALLEAVKKKSENSFLISVHKYKKDLNLKGGKRVGKYLPSLVQNKTEH